MAHLVFNREVDLDQPSATVDDAGKRSTNAETLYSNHFRGSPENRWQITDGTLTDLWFGRKVRCMFFTLAVRLEVPAVSVE